MNYDVVKVFDFDDTLATSHGYIRVLHYERGRPTDTTKWLGAMGIRATADVLGSARMSTEDYAKYAKITHKMAERGDLAILKPGESVGNVSSDVVDYEGVSKLHKPEPIEHILKIAKRAQKEKTLIGIITGRSGSDFAMNVLGESIPVNNRLDIFNFLKSCGLRIDIENIHCAGDLPGGVPYNKARVMAMHFVEKYNPNTILFYDDDPRNLSAVESVDRRIRCIDAKEIGNGWGTVRSVLEAGRARRREISMWSNANKNVGFDK